MISDQWLHSNSIMAPRGTQPNDKKSADEANLRHSQRMAVIAPPKQSYPDNSTAIVYQQSRLFYRWRQKHAMITTQIFFRIHCKVNRPI